MHLSVVRENENFFTLMFPESSGHDPYQFCFTSDSNAHGP